VAVLFIVWIVSHTRFENIEVPTRLKGEAARNPFYGAIRFSEELGAEASWERVFATPRNDAVIVLNSWNWNLSRTRRERIEHWVEAGGRLIIDNSLIGESDEFESWSGIGELKAKRKKSTFRDGTRDEQADEDEDETDVDDETVEEAPADDAETAETAEPAESETTDDFDAEEESEEADAPDDDSFLGQLLPKDCPALTEDVSKRQIKVCNVSHYRSLTSSRKILWALRDGDKIQALRTAVGRGSVTVINATPFRFRGFLLGDHPLLFATMTQLHHDDLVLFLTEEEHASLISLMWRFGAPAVLLMVACIVLGIWRSTSRFGPPVAATLSARRSLAEQIRGTGLFALRFGSGKALHAASLRALRDAAVRKFPRYDRMSSQERVDTVARASGVNGEDLRQAMNHIGVRSSHELRQAIAVLETARRRLLQKKAKHGN
jgi:hypothetical protein